MPRLRNPGTGLVVSCEGDLAAHYQSLGWESADSQPAKAAPEKPESKESEDSTDDDKPVTRRSTRRK